MASLLEDDTLISRTPDTIVSDVVGNAVIMDIANGHFIELNATAARLWGLLETPLTLAALCENVMRDYAVPPAVCREQVNQWLGQMQALNAVRLDHSAVKLAI